MEWSGHDESPIKSALSVHPEVLLLPLMAKLVITVIFSARWLFCGFGSPPNSDMDYRIFNVRKYIHTGDLGL